METKELYREILNEHNINPVHKKSLEGANLSLSGVNPSCGDEIVLNLKVQDGKIADGSFTGVGCAVSQASVDMMLDLVIGKTIEEARFFADIFRGMVQGKASESDIEKLDEAASLRDISRMPARVKCAMLGWRTMKEMLDKKDVSGMSIASSACDCCAATSKEG